MRLPCSEYQRPTGRTLTVAVTLGVALLACRPSIAAEPAADSHVVRSLHEVMWDYVAADKTPPPDSLAAKLGPACDVAEKFGKLDAADMRASSLLTPHSQVVAARARGGESLARLQKLRAENWYSSVVDVGFVDDALASVIFVFTPRPTEGPKPVEALYLVRIDDKWKISIALDGDAAEIEAAHPGAIQTLRDVTKKRMDEIASVTTRPLDKPLPFSGVWASHFAQSGIYLAFNQNGEVLVLITREGSSSYDLYDFHLAGDEIVIESPIYPVRLRQDFSTYWEHDGKRYGCLVTKDARAWFPDLPKKELFNLVPSHKADYAVRRPAPSKTPASEK